MSAAPYLVEERTDFGHAQKEAIKGEQADRLRLYSDFVLMQGRFGLEASSSTDIGFVDLGTALMNRPRARELAANHRRQYINNMPNNLTPSANRLPEPKRARLSNKLKSALDDMVWNGAPFDEAARAAITASNQCERR